MTGVFSRWQPVYAERGIATFPCTETKTPAVRNYHRFGLPASTALASRFRAASAFGFMCGRRSGITPLDIDCKDERVLAEAIDRHGKTPIVVRSGSGNSQAWYKYSGERRQIRPWPGLPLDILGGGFVVAPPSKVEKGEYQFIQGSLDDLDRLPALQNLSAPAPIQEEWANKRKGDGRNNVLFRLVARAARTVDDIDQLLDYARTRNSEFAELMLDAEVVRVVNSAWKMQCEGRNRFGTYGSWSSLEEVKAFIEDPDAFFLLAFLRSHNGPNATFIVTNGLGDQFGWHRRRLAEARRRLIDVGYFSAVRQAGKGHAALFRWANAAQMRSEPKGGRN
jgi:hypothetical protein